MTSIQQKNFALLFNQNFSLENHLLTNSLELIDREGGFSGLCQRIAHCFSFNSKDVCTTLESCVATAIINGQLNDSSKRNQLINNLQSMQFKFSRAKDESKGTFCYEKIDGIISRIKESQRPSQRTPTITTPTRQPTIAPQKQTSAPVQNKTSTTPTISTPKPVSKPSTPVVAKPIAQPKLAQTTNRNIEKFMPDMKDFINASQKTLPGQTVVECGTAELMLNTSKENRGFYFTALKDVKNKNGQTVSERIMVRATQIDKLMETNDLKEFEGMKKRLYARMREINIQIRPFLG